MRALQILRWLVVSAVVVAVGFVVTREDAETMPGFFGDPGAPSTPAVPPETAPADSLLEDSLPEPPLRGDSLPEDARGTDSLAPGSVDPGATKLAAAPDLPSASSVADSRARAALGADLSGLLDTFRWRDAEWGVLVVSLERGDTLFRHNATRAFAPASNAKLLTSLVALDRLGPDYRFRTYLLSDGAVRDGVLEGDLVLFGTGDPGFSQRFHRSRTGVFEELAQTLAERGIRRIRGDLVADASFLPGPLRPAGWDPEDLDDHFAPGISALSFNENVVSFRLVPGAWVGAPPEVHTIPEDAGLPVVNRGVTVEGRPSPQISLTRKSPLDPFVVSGEIQRGGRDVWRAMTVQRPAHFTGTIFRDVLADAGIRVDGELRLVEEPSRSVLPPSSVVAPTVGRAGPRILASWTSPPLLNYLEVVNKDSNNLFAELVFRTLGRDRSGTGDAAEGARAVRESLQAMGVDVQGLDQLDGSGLSEGNRVAAGTLVGLLGAAQNQPWWEAFWSTLPEAGRPRELGRMYRTAAAGNLRAKTGTIARVSALSGVVRSADGEALAFSILVNGTPSPYRAKRVENAIGARLATFRRSD